MHMYEDGNLSGWGSLLLAGDKNVIYTFIVGKSKKYFVSVLVMDGGLVITQEKILGAEQIISTVQRYDAE